MNAEHFERFKTKLQLNDAGLIPAIIQDAASRTVLTLCYMNEAALKKTLEEGFIYVFRRSQGKLMKKGETSGHTQTVREVRVDCEGKSLLFVVNQKVAGCHRGYFSCYFETMETDGTIRFNEERVFDPEKVY